MSCFDFLEEKIKEEKNNPNGIFAGYFAYDLSDFFFAYFDNCYSCESRSLDRVTCKEQGLDSCFHGNDKTNLHLTSNMSDSEYLKKVNQIKEEIKAGNVYQVNLTREYSIEYKDINDLDLYLRLRETSPNPYGCFFRTPFVTILSSSPEEFLYAGPQEPLNRIIRTRPVKGTFSKNIFDVDEKNKAENIMIVDIERNDLGKICEYGSVNATKLLEIEPYQHLNHAVSTVEGKLRQDVSLREIFEATFPGGSITGAPKIAAMKIINDVTCTKS